MTGLSPRLVWYFNRLKSMPPPEIPHRVREAAAKRRDRQGATARMVAAVPDAALAGPLPALPLDLERVRGSAAAERARLAGLAERILSGDLRLLGMDWPVGARRAWDLDPGSGRRWPSDRSCFDIPYRLESGPGDVKFVWELNRLQHLVVLALAGLVTRNTALHATVVADLDDWIQKNPPYLGVSWACGIEAASRVASVLAIVGLVGAPAFSSEQAARLQRSLYAHGVWLARYPSLYSSANNHRIAEAAALLLLGRLAPHLPGAAAWAAEGKAALEEEVALQIFSDGVCGEQAPTYQAYTLEWYALARRVAEATGERLAPIVDERLAAGAAFLRAVMDRSGHVPHIGDDDGAVVLRTSWTRAEDVASVLNAVASALHRPDLLAPGAAPDARSGLLGVEVGAPPETPPPSASFPEGGYTVIRHTQGERELLAVLDHGPLGYGPIAAHGHADALNLCLHVDGVPVLIDPGAYRYNHSGGWRDHLRSTAAHNTVEVGGAWQSESTGAFNWGARARCTREVLRLGGDTEAVTASHDGYHARFGVVHRRRVEVAGVDTARIHDDLTGDASALVRLCWHFGPEVTVTEVGGRWRLRLPGGRLIHMHVEGPALSPRLARQDGPMRPGPGACSPEYNALVPCTSLILEGEVRLPARWETALDLE